jgi:hypothetical protein
MMEVADSQARSEDILALSPHERRIAHARIALHRTGALAAGRKNRREKRRVNLGPGLIRLQTSNACD